MAWLKKYSLNWPAPLYVLLLAAFPVLYLYAYNIREMDLGQALLPLAVSLAGAVLLWALLTLLLRDGRKAGLAIVLFLLFFFTYGRLYQGLEDWGVLVPGHTYLLPGILLLWGYSVYFISRVKGDFRTTTTIINIIAAVLIIINLTNILIYEITKPKFTDNQPAKATSAAGTVPGASQSLPDIYLIILDEYAHPDTMKGWYDYDSSKFIKSLEGKGFFIAKESKTRSPQTPETIAQVVNMEYLTRGWYWDETKRAFNKVAPDTGTGYSETVAWSDLTYWKYAHNKVAELLRTKGYKYVYFGNWLVNGKWASYVKDYADLYFNYSETADTAWVSEFQDSLGNTTMLRPFYSHLVGSQYESYYKRSTLSTLAHLKEMPAAESPKFVFAHLMCPHEPFTLNAKGEAVALLNYQNYKDKRFYLGQYIFISEELEKIADSLLAKSKIPPIIIIQSDHGLRPHHPGIVIGKDEWRKILNAMYLPGMDKTAVHDSISPVNTFRLVFNQYFNTDYELLPDD